MIIILVGSIIIVQLLYFNRSYLTTDYTKQRESSLNLESKNFFSQYMDALVLNDKESLLNRMNAFANQNNVYCILFDRNGNTIVASDNLKEFKSEYLDFIRESIVGSVFNENMTKSFRVKTKYGYPTQYIAVITRQSSFSNSEHYYFVSITKEVYTNESYLEIKKYAMYLMLAIMIGVIIIAVSFSYYITKPVLQITDVAIQISRLDFSRKCNYNKKDEIGIWAECLNNMSDKLSDTISQLEKTNGRLENELDLQKSFIADASHELKTPLTIIRGYIEILSDKDVGEDIQFEAMDTITYEVDRMDKLVNDLLDLSKLESDGYQLEKEQINCANLLKGVADSYDMLMNSKDIIFIKEFDKEIGNIMANRYSIEQVIRNFISNAIKYTESQKRIVMSGIKKDGQVKISIFNEGHPIEKEELDRIWNKFYRIDKARSKETGGTGLGLSICKMILERHGYEYGVRNVEDGVVFYFIAKIV